MYRLRSTFLLFLFAAPPGSSFAPSLFLTPRSTTRPLRTKATDSADEFVLQVQTAERKVKSLNNLLTTLERRSTQDRLEWIKERTTLTRKISVLKELLRDATPVPDENKDQSETIEALELELDMAHGHEDVLTEEQDRLEREVLILQDQIVMIRNLLKTEQYRSADLEEQLDEVQEEQESESTIMHYQIQVEAQAREIEAMRAKLQFYEQHGPQPIYATHGKAPQNETVVAMTL